MSIRARPIVAADNHHARAGVAGTAALDQLLAEELALIPDGRAKGQGIMVGDKVASLLLAARADDGSATTPAPFVAGSQPGNYRSTLPNFPRRSLVTGAM